MTRHADRSGFYDYSFSKLETEESTYEVGGVIPYPGSDEVGAPVKVWIVCGKKGSGVKYSVRLFDKTNATVIASQFNEEDVYPTLKDMGTIANVTEGPAIWEVQIKKTEGDAGKTAAVSSAVMEF